VAPNAGELAVNTRSMIQIMMALSTYVAVPEDHLKSGRALPALASQTQAAPAAAIEVHSGKQKPPEAFASVFYKDHWFWIDDGDWRTKRAFAFIMFLFTLADTGSPERLPLITIPAQ
jgi:hypothetical protein